MKKAIFIVLFIYFIFLASPILAIYDPISMPNNKYGIHIIDQNDLINAANLVNSTGGDWGYVTLVITQNDLKKEKWQNIFNSMRQLHLIPILRLATEIDGNIWLAPDLSRVEEYAQFLNSLTWVIKNRYVIIFNEPNHSKEWGGTIDPEGYTQILASYSATLKSRSNDFYILQAGFDAAARNTSNTMDEELFIKKMIDAQPKIFDYIDGWNSHSYPHPLGTYKKYSNNRESLESYKWEINLLKNLGVTRKLPVFITETGWPHFEGIPDSRGYLSSANVSDLIRKSTEDLLTDPQIVAFTPFILNYQSYPFSNFSWQKPNSNDFYPQFYTYRDIVKKSGFPILEVLYSPTITPTLSIEKNNIKGISSVSKKSSINIIINKIINNSKDVLSWIYKRIS